MSGIDGYDWSVFGGNPAPGDPDAVRAIATQLRNLADGVDTQTRLLRSVGGDSESIWVGPAANAFKPHVDKLPGQMDKLTQSYRDAGDALDGYWPDLRAAQQMAVQALFKAQSALQQIETAKAQVAAASNAASSAADAYNQAAVAAAAAPPDPSGATATHLAHLQSGYQAASSQLWSANNSLGAAHANLQAAKNQADTARSTAGTAALRASSGLRAASSAGIHNPHHGFFSSLVDDVEGVVGGAVHWVEHHAEVIETIAAVATLGPAGLLLTADGRHLLSDAGHLAEEGLHDIAPILKVASGVLGVTATILAVAGLVLAPVGLGEVIDLANEAVMGLKTADDGLLIAAGDKEAVAAFEEDLVGMATGGMGRVIGDIGESASAVGEAEQTIGEVREANEALDAATSALTEASGKVTAAAARADGAASDAELLTNLAHDAGSEGNLVNAQSFAMQATSKLDERAAALTERDGALADAQSAMSRGDEALTKQSEALKEMQRAKGELEDSEKYQLTGVKSGLHSAVGGNNLDRFKSLHSDVAEFRATGVSRTESWTRALSRNTAQRGITGNFGSKFVKYYSSTIRGTSNGMGRLGAGMHQVRLFVDGREAYKGITHLGENIKLVTGG